ncbi:Alpha/Beta hydrolase protein [Aspergillus carlsbadensis]|nr:Alpha/Beta hydrolase protein [Aspergillus carlsbadensis]
MNETNLPVDPAWVRDRRKPRRWYWIAAPLLILLLNITTFLHGRPISLPDRDPDPDVEYIQYEGETLLWKPCGELNNNALECSTLSVPMDHFNATTPGSQSFTIALIRLRAPNATKNLLLNPGGPGASGFDLMHEHGAQLRAIVGDGFHLLSFDPRGVNNSSPAATCFPNVESRRDLSRVRSMDLVHDSPEVFAWTGNFVRSCADTMGDYAPYANTPQTAADMNGILDALGQEDMYYWGFSYGTILGQTYAGLFPERSKRVIIDGVADQYMWYQGSFVSESQVDADAVLDGFFGECIDAGKGGCALAALADSKEGLRDVVFGAMQKLREQPVGVYINNTHSGLVTYDNVWYNGIFQSLYKPLTWPSLAKILHDLIQGNATAAFLAYGHDRALELKDDSSSVVILNDSPTGPAHWGHDRQTILDTLLTAVNNSQFPASWSTIYYMAQQWNIPKTYTYVPKERIETAHPLLILSTSYDPVCPLIAARTAAEAFVGSRVVEIEGYGHCSIAVPSVCLAKHVRAFLYEGVLPEGDTTCQVDSPYFVPPTSDEEAMEQMRFKDEEDSQIHRAQMELARSWDYRGSFVY